METYLYKQKNTVLKDCKFGGQTDFFIWSFYHITYISGRVYFAGPNDVCSFNNL